MECKSFRGIVSESYSLKEKREYVINRLNILGSFAISKMGMTYSRVDETLINREDRFLEVNITNYIYGNITIQPNIFNGINEYLEENGTDGVVKINCKIPVKTTFYYSAELDEDKVILPSPKDKIGTTVRSKTEILEIAIDNEIIKLDKKTSEELTRIIFKSKLKGSPLKDFVRKQSSSSKSSVFLLPEVQKEYKLLLSKYSASQRKDLKNINKENAKIVNKIARKEKVSPLRIVAETENKYVVFDRVGFNYDETKILLSSFDTEIWAKDTGYKDAKEYNDQIVKNLQKIGTGIFVYTTHLGGTPREMRISL